MSAQSLVGRLLIALPKIEDPRFKRSVVLICAHSHDHAMGIALNRIVDELTLSELLDQMGLDGELAGHRHVLHGGPVGRGRGFVLHSEDYDCAGATLSACAVPPSPQTGYVHTHRGGKKWHATRSSYTIWKW